MVLIVEDEKLSRKALAALLLIYGYPVKAVESAEDALQLLDSGESPEVALVDLDLPGMSGEELLKHLARDYPDVRAVLLTAADSDRLASLGHDGRVMHLRKPVDLDRLLSILPKRGPEHHAHYGQFCG
jgi:CheY-like chemotaxis protein